MMITRIPAREARGRALLFFSGWGMDVWPFKAFLPANRDCLVCGNYRDLDFDESLLTGYHDILLAAWSMGVWAAGMVMAKHRGRISRAVAVNGTSWPIDNAKGIPEAVFTGTLRNFSAETLERFNRRMCGSKAARARFAEHAPRRSPAGLHLELQRLHELYRQLPPVSFAWDLAVISAQDRIFPPENQRNAWRGTPTVIINAPHYPEFHWQAILAGNIDG